jgi:ArsR family metal-binding transcriptional regulator
VRLRKDKFFIVKVSVLILTVGSIIFMVSDPGKNTINNIKNKKDAALSTAILPSIETKRQDEEVPHFNLFSIINKFIPH